MQKKRWSARYLMILKLNVSSQVNSSHIPMQAYSNISMSHAEMSSHIQVPIPSLSMLHSEKTKDWGSLDGMRLEMRNGCADHIILIFFFFILALSALIVKNFG